MSRFALALIVAAALVAAPPARAQEKGTGTDTTSSLPVSKLETFTGFYEAGNGRGITITLEDGKLYGQPSTDSRRELLFREGTTFLVAGTQRPMTLTFVVGTDGRVTEMVMRQGDQERRFPKVR